MSSILEALKKAERDAAVDHGPVTPWPAPPSESPSAATPRRGGRWILTAIVLLGVISAVVVWQFRRLDAPMPTHTPTVPVDSDHSPVIADRSLQPVAPPPANPPLPAAAAPAMTPAASHPAPEARSPTIAPAPPPKHAPGALHGAPPTKPVAVAPPPPPERKSRLKGDASGAPIAETTPPPAIGDKDADQIRSTPDAEKIFRHDPRIQLQALVWSPVAGERFVLINNRLIKEGGSVDNIVVVSINRDDVLLSEGGDQWYERFQVR